MEVFGCGYARRPSIAEGLEAVRQRKFSVRSKGSADENDENSDGYKGEIVSNPYRLKFNVLFLYYKKNMFFSMTVYDICDTCQKMSLHIFRKY